MKTLKNFFRKPQKKIDENFAERFEHFENNPDLESIFDSVPLNEVFENNEPSDFIMALGRILHAFEMTKPNEKIDFDFSQLDDAKVLDAVDEVTQHHHPTLEGYKILKVAFYMLTVTAVTCNALRERNPIAARVNSMLSANGFRLVFAADAAISNSQVQREAAREARRNGEEPEQATRNDVNMTVFTGVMQTQYHDTKDEYMRNTGTTIEPWELIDQKILQNCGLDTDQPLDDPNESVVYWFYNLSNIMSNFSRARAVKANVFYVGIGEIPASSISFKVTPIAVNEDQRVASMRGRELSKNPYQNAQTKLWGSLPNNLLLAFQIFHSEKYDKTVSKNRVSTTYFKRIREKFKKLEDIYEDWLECLGNLKLEGSPKKYNSGHLLSNHIIVKDKCQVQVEGIIAKLSDAAQCDEVLYDLEATVLKLHLASAGIK